jgi:hypothetical protein
MERIVFPPGEEPTEYRSELCDLFGGWQTCPGIATAERCDIEDQTRTGRSSVIIGAIAKVGRRERH